MTLLGADRAPAGPFDCCVVGAGPIGLAVALEAAGTGARVLLVEAGGLRPARRSEQADSGRTVIADERRHAPLDLTVRSAVGGTSWLWGGRCVPFEPLDLADRAHVPSGRWPLAYDDVARWYPTAAEHLDCGPAVFASTEPGWAGLGDVRMSNLERWARRPRLGPGLGARVLAHRSITVLLDSPVVDAEYAGDGAVAGLVVQRDGGAITVRAGAYVLALGGLAVTRFLLAQQRSRPESFGGADGALGRFYMGHATGSIADIVLADPERVADLDFARDADRTYVRRRFTFSPDAQRRHRLLNTSFYLDNPDFFDPAHRHPTLSAVFLGIAIPPVGRVVLAEAIRRRHVGPRPYRIAAHLRNVLRKPWRVAADVVDIVRRRYLSRVRKPGFLLRNDAGRYALHYHGEQLPNPESRVTLRADAAGRPELHVDLRYLEADIDSLLRGHALLDRELRAAGAGWLEYRAADPEARREAAWAQTTDGFHSIGTTRMSDAPEDGVVDADCRVHGVRNLYIASTSVLPTSGEANPTLMGTALGVRLAHHLAALRATAAAPASTASVAGPPG
jgi:choline dehydrogenase-like flavoprotein